MTLSHRLSLSLCLFADDNWGLPLAIAANLHIPYRIEIGDTVRDLHEQDKPGQGMYIAWVVNSRCQLKWLVENLHLHFLHLILLLLLRFDPTHTHLMRELSNYYYGPTER